MRDLEKCSNILLVLRDPISRVVSAYIHKIIINLEEPKDRQRDIKNVTGIDISDLTFSLFV